MLTTLEKKKARASLRKTLAKAARMKQQRERAENPLKYREAHVTVQYEQYLLYMQDCLIPMVDVKTPFMKLYRIYIKYCKAIGQEPYLSNIYLGRCMTKHFLRYETHNGTKYGCVIRKEIIVAPELVEESDSTITILPKGLI